MYYFFAPYNNRKSFQMSTIRLNRKCSKVVEILSDIFGNIGKSSESCCKFSEVPRMFSEIPVMTRQKSHVFDSEKVGRYRLKYKNEGIVISEISESCFCFCHTKYFKRYESVI